MLSRGVCVFKGETIVFEIAILTFMTLSYSNNTSQLFSCEIYFTSLLKQINNHMC